MRTRDYIHECEDHLGELERRLYTAIKRKMVEAKALALYARELVHLVLDFVNKIATMEMENIALRYRPAIARRRRQALKRCKEKVVEDVTRRISKYNKIIRLLNTGKFEEALYILLPPDTDRDGLQDPEEIIYNK